MPDLRAMLGDRYEATFQAALLQSILTAVLPELFARAWDQGRRIGLMQADYAYGHRLTMPNLTNPYRKET